MTEIPPYCFVDAITGPICDSCDKLRPIEWPAKEPRVCNSFPNSHCKKLEDAIWKEMTRQPVSKEGKLFVDIAGVPTPLEDVNKYIDHILERIKESKIQRDRYRLATRLGELEGIRRELHAVILGRVGFMAWDPSKSAYIYRHLLERYVEWRVQKTGVFGNEPEEV